MTDNQYTQKLFCERLFLFFSRFLAAYRLPLVSAIVFGMLAHGFAFTNKFINHDEIYNLFGKGATIDSGRWALGVMDSIFPNYSMPWIYGILTVFLIALGVCCIVHVFSIQNPVVQVLLAGAVVVSPVWVSTFSFMFTSSSYGVAFLMAVLSVVLLRKSSPLHWVLALGCGIFSVGIYQAYIAVIASLLVLLLIQDLLKNEPVPLMLRRGFFYVGFLVLTLGLYYIAAQLMLILKDVDFNQYAAERDSFDLSALPGNILLAYSHFFRQFESGEHALIPTLFLRRMHYLCYAACGIMLLVMFFAKKMQLSRILFVLALVGIFPLAVNCMYLFTPESAIHTLVLCGFLSVYFPLAVITDLCFSTVPAQIPLDWLRRASMNVLLFALSAILISNTYFANEAFLALHLQYENTYAFCTSLLSDIRMHPEFDEDTQLAIVGQWDYPDYFFRKFEFTYHLFGHLNASPSEYSMNRFLEYYIGFPISFVSRKDFPEIKNSPEYSQMPNYPYYGSIRMIDDMLVVKLS